MNTGILWQHVESSWWWWLKKGMFQFIEYGETSERRESPKYWKICKVVRDPFTHLHHLLGSPIHLPTPSRCSVSQGHVVSLFDAISSHLSEGNHQEVPGFPGGVTGCSGYVALCRRISDMVSSVVVSQKSRMSFAVHMWISPMALWPANISKRHIEHYALSMCVLKWLTPAKMPLLEYKPRGSISSTASIRAAPEQIKNTSHHAIMADLPLCGLVGQPSSHKFTQLFYLIDSENNNTTDPDLQWFHIRSLRIYIYIFENTCVTTTKILRTLISWNSIKPPFDWEYFTHGDNVP